MSMEVKVIDDKNKDNKRRRILENLWKPTRGFVLFSLISLVFLILGLSWFVRKEIYGDIITSLRNPGGGGVAWGLWIMFDIYFVGVASAGITLSVLVRLFKLDQLKPLTRPAELITIISLILGALCVLADQGRIFYALLNLPRYARPISPMFGTFSLVVSGYLSASLIYFYLSSRKDAFELSKYFEGSKMRRLLYKIWAAGWRGDYSQEKRHKTSLFWLSIVILPLIFVANSTLGFIFGIQVGRPGWFSALQAPGFVIMAGISGIGLIMVVAYILRKIYKLEELIGERTFYTLGFILFVLLTIYLYFTVVEELTAHYAAPEKDRYIAHQITIGKFAPIFWINVVSLLFPAIYLFYQTITRRVNIFITALSGFIVNVSAVLKRFLIVVPSQTHGLYLPYQEGSYFPALSEIVILLGIIGFGILLFIFFAKIFPIIPLEVLEEEKEEEKEEKKKEEEVYLPSRVRLIFAFGTIALGLFLMVLGFVFSARFGTKPYLDPILPFSPVIFISGVIISFFSAVVYELFPSRRRI